jgi:hypothetical protein
VGIQVNPGLYRANDRAPGASNIHSQNYLYRRGQAAPARHTLNLHGTLLQTTTADLRLFGATTMTAVSTGDDNTAHVLLNQATGGGARANLYAHSSTPPMGSPGIGNRLEIVGNAHAFDQTNQNFVPPPPAEFFTGRR